MLIDGDGTFNVAGFEHITKEVKLGGFGLSYAVVSKMGPQSSDMLSFLTLKFHCFFCALV